MSFDPGLPDDSINVSGTHPLKEAGLLLGGMIGAVILFVIAVGASIDWLAPLLPPGLEMKLLGSFGEPDEDAIEPSDSDEQRLQALVDRMASHWADNPYSFRAAILGDDDPNAFAFPGGWIVVSRGLLEQTDSENELAFVVSHEIGHFKNRDHLRGLGRGVALALAMSVVASSGAGVAGDLASLAGSLAGRSFDRDQEVDADAFGLGLVYAEYGHVGGATEFFRKAPEFSNVIGDTAASYLSTHPLHDDRIEALLMLALQKGWPKRGQLMPFESESGDGKETADTTKADGDFE